MKRNLVRGLPGLVLLAWVATGVYTVESEELAVVKRFGRVTDRAVPSGIHWRLPWPIESHEKFETTTVYKMGAGMITRDFLRGIPSPEELSLWLTGDTNILSVKIMIQYAVVDLADYLYRMEGGQFLMARIAEAAITEVLGSMGVDDALTVERPRIAAEIRERTQAHLDALGLGISINSVNLLSVDPPSQVIDVFRDVQNAAADRERIMNEASGYANSVIPRARGEARWVLERAKAERDARIQQAEGDAARFLAVLEEYRKIPEATRQRLYLEAMEEVLPRVKRYVVDLEEGESLDLRILDLERGELMDDLGRLVVAAAGVTVLTLAGGLLPLVREWSRPTVRLLLAFGTGVLLGAAFFHMIPLAAQELGQNVGVWVLAGFLLIYVTERFVMMHPCEEEQCSFHHMGLAAFFGITLHAFIDGLALGAGIAIPSLSVAVTAAIVLHKLPAAVSLAGILLHCEYPRRKILPLIFAFALATPVGAAVSFFLLRDLSGAALPAAVALSAGTFLAIATADLLPQIHSAPEGRFRNLAALFLGLLVISFADEVAHATVDRGREDAADPGSGRDPHAGHGH